MEEWYECVLADFDGPVRSCEELPCLRAVMLCIPDAEAVQWYGGKKYSILFLYLFKFEIILTFKKKKRKKASRAECMSNREIPAIQSVFLNVSFNL